METRERHWNVEVEIYFYLPCKGEGREGLLYGNSLPFSNSSRIVSSRPES